MAQYLNLLGHFQKNINLNIEKTKKAVFCYNLKNI